MGWPFAAPQGCHEFLLVAVPRSFKQLLERLGLRLFALGLRLFRHRGGHLVGHARARRVRAVEGEDVALVKKKIVFRSRWIS